MNWLTVPVDLAIGIVGICLGEVDALRRLARRAPKVKHEHAWESWELTPDKIRRYTSARGWHENPVQQRKCLGCGRIERDELDT